MDFDSFVSADTNSAKHPYLTIPRFWGKLSALMIFRGDTMERESNSREPSGPSFWGLGIYVCLAAVIISLLFASCKGGPVYDGPAKATPTPPPLIQNSGQ